MTPAQLRAFSAVVRLGSVRAAAAELGVSDAGVSMHVAALRKELEDPLFTKTGAGLAFTPGGLRLASRAVEILGLQQQTAIEVVAQWRIVSRAVGAGGLEGMVDRVARSIPLDDHSTRHMRNIFIRATFRSADGVSVRSSRRARIRRTAGLPSRLRPALPERVR